MAVTETASRLTEAHRLEQAKNGALVSYVVAQLFLKAIDLNDITGSAAALLERLVPAILKRRRNSALIARRYYTAFRAADYGTDGFELPPMTELNLQALQTSLRVTGEVALKQRIAALPADSPGFDLQPSVSRALLEQAVELTAQDIAGAATRHVMNGGRDELQSAVAADPVALGYVRVTDSDPCFFCAMLASRGPVYGAESFDDSDPRFIGEGEHKVHDHCQCATEPVYSRATEWPGRAREFEDMWIQLSEDLGRAPTALDWRRRYEGRKR
jgi:hypothetical protein